MQTVSPVSFDFSQGQITVNRQGEKIVLCQDNKAPTLKVEPENVIKNKLQGEQVYFLIQVSTVEKQEENKETTKRVSKLLEEYEDVFSIPVQLPPKRRQDHHIPIKEGSKPVNANPYRCPYFQKEEIEKIIKEMLSNGIIRHSTSPFASPVLLVKKKDNSWRMVVDYRALNSITIKNKYPIPIIEELLAELKGSQVFTKLDLRSGYHHIRVNETDVFKTDFKTHQGHYEFLVMPFGLTNAPATFQALMNEVFSEQLRKFVLVFFDDILIYSKNEKEHLLHLKAVLEILRSHQLFVKKSKCSFNCPKVEYLGHIISPEGVSADQEKIQAMKEWPKPNCVRALRGFLGLTGYYRRFIKGYGIVSKPLIQEHLKI